MLNQTKAYCNKYNIKKESLQITMYKTKIMGSDEGKKCLCKSILLVLF